MGLKMKIFSISDLHLDINNSKPMDIFGPVWKDYLDKIIYSYPYRYYYIKENMFVETDEYGDFFKKSDL